MNFQSNIRLVLHIKTVLYRLSTLKSLLQCQILGIKQFWKTVANKANSLQNLKSLIDANFISCYISCHSNQQKGMVLHPVREMQINSILKGKLPSHSDFYLIFGSMSSNTLSSSVYLLRKVCTEEKISQATILNSL